MPMQRDRYPDNWEEISDHIRFERAEGRCEWVDADGRCEARHLGPHPLTGSRVILTTAHMDHDPINNDETNLKALCNLHHLRYDALHHARNAAETRRQKKIATGQLVLLEVV